ncbi:hypothetical protein ISN45_Aa07g004350 [Arabidopsis thaliana x Arabidopsis arenosa]|uniref:Uncharacterized protein n=1 Tax=Arabidopsis thaliana x Arabidopsis arenosa TaxID=1240361 RepID=A0A8T1XZN3_9BRAS|nr:hypothetical protein ISN45_Aa07g004350 [Arabidopsis thaliana x Arabidopsis arenosa]
MLSMEGISPGHPPSPEIHLLISLRRENQVLSMLLKLMITTDPKTHDFKMNQHQSKANILHRYKQIPIFSITSQTFFKIKHNQERLENDYLHNRQ